MKKSIFKITIAALLLFGTPPAFSQTRAEWVAELGGMMAPINSAVKDIHNMELYVFSQLYGPFELNLWLYFDSDKRLRIYQTGGGVDMLDGRERHYFDEAGNLIYSMLGTRYAMDNYYSVTKYTGAQLYRYDFYEWNGDGEPFLRTRFLSSSYHDDASVCFPPNHTFEEMKDVGRTKAYMNRSFNISDKTIRAFVVGEDFELPDRVVRFREPTSGDTTFVSRNRVPVYEKARKSSKVLGELYVGDLLTVVEVKPDMYGIRVIRSINNLPDETLYMRRGSLLPVEERL